VTVRPIPVASTLIDSRRSAPAGVGPAPLAQDPGQPLTPFALSEVEGHARCPCFDCAQHERFVTECGSIRFLAPPDAQSGFFATPTSAGRNSRSLSMYPACISWTIVPGSASALGTSSIA
jgi:hypothetical protein